MTWEYNGYTWKSGWFIEELTWDGGDWEHYLKFSADGVTTKGYGAPGVTVATNYAELISVDGESYHQSYNASSRRKRTGDNIRFDFNEESIVITGLPNHPILGVEALTQTLDKEVEVIDWMGTAYDDTITINVNSFNTSGERFGYEARAGNDIFYVNGDVTPLLECGLTNGVWVQGGSGNDYLVLAGSLDDWDVKISPDQEGFDITPWGTGSCANIMTRDVEIVYGDDFTWTFGDRFPVMGAPDSRDVEDSSGIKNNLIASEESGSSSSGGGTTVINNYITNTTTSVSNNTNNTTTTNISNSGSGNINVGDIGVVNNTTNIDNSFTIQTISVNLSFAITGDSKKSEKVEGTDGDDLIADGFGKDKLIGGDGADQFYFSGEEPFKKKTVDKVIDFNASEGDAILIDEDVVSNPAVNDQIIENLADTSAAEIPVAENNSQLKQLSDDGHQFIYNEPKGELLIDSNGEQNGFAGKDADPLLANLGKNTELTDALIDDVLDELEADPSLAIAESKKELKSLAKEDYDLIYFEPKGDLYVDGNGDAKGFGNKSEGGMIADLPNDTILTESDVLIGV